MALQSPTPQKTFGFLDLVKSLCEDFLAEARLFTDYRPSCSPGSYHHRQVCHYCPAVRSLLDGEPEELLYTYYGEDSAHWGQ